MGRKKIVVLGSSFAGMTAAVELKNRAGDQVEVVVIAKSDRFVFMPSLIWVPFGLREPEDLTFELGPVLEKKGVTFHHETVGSIDLENRRVRSTHGRDESYDYLVLATGAVPAFDLVPGLGPKNGHTQSIFTLEDALTARRAFERFLERPGPVVIGGVQGCSTFGPAYELLLNLAHQLDRRGLKGRAKLTYLTAEPYVGHLGLGGVGAHNKVLNGAKLLGQLFARYGIEAQPGASVAHVEPGEIVCSDGRRFDFAFAMLAPALRGTRPVRALGAPIVDEHGFVRVASTYQLPTHPEVYAAGVAISLPPAEATPIPCGVPKTGYVSEEMARVVAHNIVADLHDEPKLEVPAAELDDKWVMDAGDTGLLVSAEHLLEPREREWVVPGPEAHWAKLAFEKLFLATHRRGLV